MGEPRDGHIKQWGEGQSHAAVCIIRSGAIFGGNMPIEGNDGGGVQWNGESHSVWRAASGTHLMQPVSPIPDGQPM